jgi:threonine dehydrogenase-like Zn-dependent dehydrogenase
MKAIILNQPFAFEHKNIDFDPTLKPDEVLLKIHAIGICGTDYHAYKGNQPFFTYPRRLGHELGVEIVAAGDRVEAARYPLSCGASVEPYESLNLTPPQYFF